MNELHQVLLFWVHAINFDTVILCQLDQISKLVGSPLRSEENDLRDWQNHEPKDDEAYTIGILCRVVRLVRCRVTQCATAELVSISSCLG